MGERPIRSVWLAALGILMLGAASACGGDGSVREEALPEYVREQLATASEYQRAALKDGEVSASEYESAVLAMLACLDDEGIPHSDPQLRQEGHIPKWEYTYGPFSKDEEERINSIYQACFNEYERAIGIVWTARLSPSEVDARELRETVVKCLRDRGITIANYEAIALESSTWSTEQVIVTQKCHILVYNGQNLFDD